VYKKIRKLIAVFFGYSALIGRFHNGLIGFGEISKQSG